MKIHTHTKPAAAVSFLAFLLLVGCAGAPAPGPAVTGPRVAPSAVLADRCPDSNPAAPGAPAPVVQVLDPVYKDRAPLPGNDAERLVFGHLYETLTRVDCAGKLGPGLASAWEGTADGRSWDVTLRNGAAFWDGTPVTAADVARAWLRSAARDLDRPRPSAFQWLGLGFGSLTVLDERRLRIRVSQPMDDLPLLLADADLAVAAHDDGMDGWPRGTGPCRPSPDPPPPGTLVLVPNEFHPAPPGWKSLEILGTPADGNGPALHPRTDLAVVRDAETVAALRRTAEFRVQPLPWDRLYLLICPPERFGTTEEERQRFTTGWSRRDLALESAPAEAEPAENPFFYEPGARICPLQLTRVKNLEWPRFDWPGLTASRDVDLVIHPSDDPVATALAERLARDAGRPIAPGPESVGTGPLTRPPRAEGGLAPQAVGVSDSDFAGAVQSGQAGAYVLPVRRTSPSACRQMAAVLGLAGWLQEAAVDPDVSDRPYPEGSRPARPVENEDVPDVLQTALRLERAKILLPLLYTRPVLVARPTVVGVRVDFDGTLDLTRAGLLR